MKSCTFLGHRSCPQTARDALLTELERLILQENVRVFYVGTQGGFDKLVYEVVCSLEKHYDIKVIVVLAYLNKKNEHIYYDLSKTIFPECLEKAPPRFAINRRNIYMLEKSDYLVCYLNDPFSNTYKFVEKDIKMSLKVINLGNYALP